MFCPLQVPPPPHPNALAEALNFVPICNEYATTGRQKQGTTLYQFPRQKLKLIEKMGEGQFGEVYRAAASRIYSDGKSNNDLSVAVKVLRDAEDEEAR